MSRAHRRLLEQVNARIRRDRARRAQGLKPRLRLYVEMRKLVAALDSVQRSARRVTKAQRHFNLAAARAATQDRTP
jgi:hypothetical protein